MERDMGKSLNFQVQFTREDGNTVIDGQPNYTRKSAKHRAKQLSSNNFKLTDFSIIHPDGTQEALNFDIE